MSTIEQLLHAARDAIAVEPAELKEARRRRRLVEEAACREFPGCRVVPNGSLAHGDANTPLFDWDLVIVVPNFDGEYGPGGKNATNLKERIRDRVRDDLADEFPNLRIEIEGRKRSVLIRFSEPVSPGTTDFSGDVICAVDHADKGLWIPRHNGWDRSDPEEHSRIMRDANAATGSAVARTVRLLKHWNARHGKPMCSWQMKVLAREVITVSMAMAEALKRFFDHAADAIEAGDTPDPAGVGPDIRTNLPRSETVSRLRTAGTAIRAAVEAEKDGRPLLAQHHLAGVLPDIVPEPDQKALDEENFRFEVKRIAAGVSGGVAAGSQLLLPRNRGWSDR